MFARSDGENREDREQIGDAVLRGVFEAQSGCEARRRLWAEALRAGQDSLLQVRRDDGAQGEEPEA